MNVLTKFRFRMAAKRAIRRYTIRPDDLPVLGINAQVRQETIKGVWYWYVSFAHKTTHTRGPRITTRGESVRGKCYSEAEAQLRCNFVSGCYIVALPAIWEIGEKYKAEVAV